MPLLHACRSEVPPTPECRFVTSLTNVREEREDVQQNKTTYKCLGKEGNFFLVCVTSLSLPPDLGIGC